MAGTGGGGAALGPLHLTPLLVDKPWGGRRLERLGRPLPPGKRIGESWEVADLEAGRVASVDDPVTRVAAGPLAGRSLGELITADRDALLGASPDVAGRFPLLVKLLDARENLSVQVHPPAAYVAERPEVHLKTESWVVLEADPGAELMIGLRDGTRLADVEELLGTAGIVELLRCVPAEPGAVHHLPAGTVHALGAGVLVAEVQTPSDTTFRLYDWGREEGREPRPLHLEAGRRAIELGWEHNVGPWAAPTHGGTRLVDTPHYRIDRHRLVAGVSRTSEGGRARVVQVLSGTLEGDGFAWPLSRGGVVVLPATWTGELSSPDGCELLETTP